MNTIADTKNVTHLGYQFQSSKGYLDVAQFGGVAIAAASTTGIHAAIITAALISTGITQPDVARVATITGTGADHDATGNVIINGIDIRGQVISDTITLNSNTTVAGVKAMASITSIDTTGVTGLDATAGVSIGTGVAIGLGRLQTFLAPLFTTVDGAADSAPTVTKDAAVISKNTITFATAPNASHVYAFGYVTTDLYGGNA